MRSIMWGVLAFVLALVAAPVQGADLSATAMAGYKGGLGFKASGMITNFARGFPLGMELSVAFTTLDPGRPADARKVFINDATNGTPQESGRIWDFRFDFLYPVHLLGMQNAHVYAGVRRSLFTGNFVYVGGNEDFDVVSNQWGVGGGLRAVFPIARNIGFMVQAGLDYFPNTTLTGHDTSYGPDGENVNGRQGYAYKDADAAVNQPKLQGLVMAGISIGF